MNRRHFFASIGLGAGAVAAPGLIGEERPILFADASDLMPQGASVFTYAELLAAKRNLEIRTSHEPPLFAHAYFARWDRPFWVAHYGPDDLVPGRYSETVFASGKLST